MARSSENPSAIIWKLPNGDPVTCYDKIAVLNENLKDLRREAQDVLEDALLMGCDEAQVRSALVDIVQTLKNPYKK